MHTRVTTVELPVLVSMFHSFVMVTSHSTPSPSLLMPLHCAIEAANAGGLDPTTLRRAPASSTTPIMLSSLAIVDGVRIVVLFTVPPNGKECAVPPRMPRVLPRA